MWSLLTLTVTLGGLMSVAVAGQDASPQEAAEAQAFFRQVASRTHNPLIAYLAEENVKKLQQTKPAPTRQVVVPLMEQPDTSLVVPLLINNNVMATFLVDTGASYTVITPALAQKLGVVITPDTPRTTLITANGTVEAPVVTLKNVSLGPVKVSEVSVVVQQLGNGDDPLLSGLLGMNFFKGMDLTLRGDELVIGLHNPD